MTDKKERNVYEEMYTHLARETEKAILILIKAQQKCEEIFVEAVDDGSLYGDVEVDMSRFENYMGFWTPDLPISEEKYNVIKRYLENCQTTWAKKWLAYMEEE